nr:thiamine phosphate synthase [Sedimentibacter sp.]
MLKLKVNKNAMRLYVVTDRTWLGTNSLPDQVEQTIAAGATFIQLREKYLSYDEFVKAALEIKAVTDKYKIPFVINDDVNVAVKVNADGIHVGQSDLDARDVRQMIGEDKILGVSVQTVEQAKKAENSGADYLGVGAVFSTSTKDDADNVSLNTLKQICSAVNIPVVAIGGISENNILELAGSGVDGVAVISSIFANPDIKKATNKLLELSNKMVLC